MDSAAAALERLCDPGAEVSAHYLISETGTIYAMVPEEARAWHAGAGSWGAVTDVNSRSIGIELSNTGEQPFAAPQMAALEGLLSQIMGRWGIPPERVIGHSDTAPGRKIDPGARFDWWRLARGGLSVWPVAAAAPGGATFRDLAQTIGYGADHPEETLLSAFRLRFRPWARGPLEALDLALAADLAQRFPVDRRGSGA